MLSKIIYVSVTQERYIMHKRIKALLITILCLGLIFSIGIPCFSDDTAKNLSKYLALLGLETNNNNIKVDEDFLSNKDNVIVMGISGTVSHGCSSLNSTQIRIMDWVSNKEVDRNDFIFLLIH